MLSVNLTLLIPICTHINRLPRVKADKRLIKEEILFIKLKLLTKLVWSYAAEDIFFGFQSFKKIM